MSRRSFLAATSAAGGLAAGAMVHSSLAAVGLTAALSGALASAGIPANVIAGYHHDHVLVPLDSWEDAVEVLHGLRPG